MKCLIIGGSKFIGKHLLLKLVEYGHEITVVNRGKTPFVYPEGVNHLIIDRKDNNAMKNTLEHETFDWVFDVCAVAGNDTKNIIEILQGNIEKFVHVSTGSVYDFPTMNSQLTKPVYEEDTIGPINENEHWYMREKRLCEKYLMEAYEKDHFPVSIIRPTFVYGPDNYIYREAYFFDRIISDRPLLIPSPGHAYFDLVHVDDVAELCIECAQKPQALGEAFNATSGEIISGETMTKLIGSFLNKEPEICYYTLDMLKETHWPEDKALYTYNDEGIVFFSPIKSAQLLGHKSKFRLRDGLNQTYQWWNKQTHPEPDWNLENSLIALIKKV